MKLIMAVVQPSRLQSVMDHLRRAGVRGFTVTNSHGVGRQRGRTETYRGLEYAVKLLPKARVEVAIDDDEVDMVVDAILAGAKSGDDGKLGDGKVFILPLEDVVRIRTGEIGVAAL